MQPTPCPDPGPEWPWRYVRKNPFDEVTLEDINSFLGLIVVTFLSHRLRDNNIFCIYF
jgi:hypothetical protein